MSNHDVAATIIRSRELISRSVELRLEAQFLISRIEDMRRNACWRRPELGGRRAK